MWLRVKHRSLALDRGHVSSENPFVPCADPRQNGSGRRPARGSVPPDVFNVAAANCDDHPKNFAFVLPEHGKWQFSPAYDVTHAYAPRSDWTHEHLMAVNGKRIGIDRRDIDTMADRFEIPGAARIVKQVLDAVDEWPRYGAAAGIPSEVVERVATDIQMWSKPLR